MSDPLRARTSPEKTESLFWAKVDKTETCWLWTGHSSHDYPGFWDGQARKRVRPYRWIWEKLHGSIPAGMQIDHLCRIPICVRPDHLDVVLGAENNRRSDSPSAINARKTHCPAGHPYDEVNTRRAITGKRQCRVCDRERKSRAA